METAYHIPRFLLIAAAAAVSLGCVEAKVGVGPFKAMSIEVGPGGAEAKGPSAGPLKLKGKEGESRRKEDD